MSINVSLLNVEKTDLRTPVYDIFISDVQGKRVAILPDPIKRLIKDVVIFESVSGEDSDGEEYHDTITINILQGSMEPYSKIEANTSILYGEFKGATPLTNKTGFITDLQFIDKSQKISAVEANTIPENKESKRLFILTKELSTDYLFKYGNKIHVAWGYLENPNLRRVTTATIVNVETTFNDSGVSSKITAAGPSLNLANMTPLTGLQFKKYAAGATKSQNQPFVTEYEYEPPSIYLTKAFNPFGISVEYESKYSDEGEELGVNKVLPAGMSLHEFATKISKDHNAGFKVQYKKDGKPILFLFDRQKFYSDIRNSNFKHLFTFNGPDSILKSVSIKTDFSQNDTSLKAAVALSENGTEWKYVTNTAQDFNIAVFANTEESVVERKRLEELGIDIDNLKQISNAQKLQYVPEKKSSASKVISESNKSVSRQKIVAVQIQCLGFPILIPGLNKIWGIGDRYSNSNEGGIYRFRTITHTINQNGYTTEASGDQYFLSQNQINKLKSKQQKRVSSKLNINAKNNKRNQDVSQKLVDSIYDSSLPDVLKGKK